MPVFVPVFLLSFPVVLDVLLSGESLFLVDLSGDPEELPGFEGVLLPPLGLEGPLFAPPGAFGGVDGLVPPPPGGLHPPPPHLEKRSFEIKLSADIVKISA